MDDDYCRDLDRMRSALHSYEGQRELHDAIRTARTRSNDDVIIAYAALLDTDPAKAWKHLEVFTKKWSPRSRLTCAAAKAHFSRLLNPGTSPPDVAFPQQQPTSPYRTGPFDVAELRQCLHDLKSGKSPGPDNVPNEILKLPECNDILLRLVNRMFVDGCTPESLRESTLLPFYKKGDKDDPSNYRGIALMQTIAKLYDRLLLQRLRAVINQFLRPNQNGFRPDRSTTQHILALRILLDHAHTYKDFATVLTFVDFSKAFDSVTWKAIRLALEAWQVPQVIIAAVFSVMEQHKLFVRTDDGDSDLFEVTIGVLQGDTLAPFLFIVVLDLVLRTSLDPALGVPLHRHSASTTTMQTRQAAAAQRTVLTDLDFADDIVLLTRNTADAQEQLRHLEAGALKVGLKINTGKGKTEFATAPPQLHAAPLTLADGRQVPHVNHYKYLGADVLDPIRDFSTRKALAWKTLTGLKPVWMSTAADSTKRKLFNATVRSVFHYGAVTWGRTQAERDRIDGSMTRMLKYALGQTGNFTLSLTDIYGKTPQATAVISAARLRLVGHALRHREDTPQPLQHLLLWDPPLRQRSSRLTTRRTILDESTLTTWHDIERECKFRDSWHAHTKAMETEMSKSSVNRRTQSSREASPPPAPQAAKRAAPPPTRGKMNTSQAQQPPITQPRRSERLRQKKEGISTTLHP
jgi:hypothetical protein